MAGITLYGITQEHLNLLQQIEEAEGELTPEMEEAMVLTQHDFEKKAVSYAGIIRTFESDEKIIDEEIKRLQKLKERKVAAKENFEERLKEAMITFNMQAIETPITKISLKKSEAVEVTDELRREWQAPKTVWVAEKGRIKAAIKAGQEIKGAKLIERQNLQIK